MTETSTIETSVLRIAGMDCAEEVSLLRKGLAGVPGIRDLKFDVMNSRLTVEYDPTVSGLDVIHAAIHHLGMRSEPWTSGGQPIDAWLLRNGRLVASALSGFSLFLAVLDDAHSSRNWILAFLTQGEAGSPATLYRKVLFGMAMLSGIWFTAPKAWRSLRSWHPDMNVLMLVSVFGALMLGEFSEAATVCFLFSLANLLEVWSMTRARREIQSLLTITPKLAVVRHGDHEHRVPVENVAVGTIVIVRPGERIPCDGEIVAGRSSVDQALLTGESIPVVKTPGDTVHAGTMNFGSPIEVRTTHDFSDSTLARVLRMVEESHHRRAPVENSIERFARYYTPAMISVAMLVALIPGWITGNYGHWFYQAMVVLLISCPCAFVIATPVTLTAALSSAASRGILVKGGAFLEALARVRVIAFDKTGVLTTGEPQVQNMATVSRYSRDDVLSLLYSLERRSEHPLGEAIARYAERVKAPTLAAERVKTLLGIGVRGEINGKDFWVGNNRLLDGDESLTSEVLEKMQRVGGSVVFCGTKKEILAVIDVTDQLRPEVTQVIRELRGLGVGKLVMLTGDGQRVARSIAAEVGIEEVHAHLLPQDKTALVQELRERCGLTAMVGDGLNDAQALASADVGIALGPRGSDVALEAADVVLMSNGVGQLPFLVQHARRALSIIKQNIAFALFMKGLFLAMAAAGVATLWMAIVADSGATLLVIFNGLRLLRVRPILENKQPRV